MEPVALGASLRRVSRRGALPEDDRRWVFNRLAGDYRRRPAYPSTLAERLLALAGGPGARVADLGAGIGHLAIPLGQLGGRVHAVEPARAMLAELVSRAGEGVVPVHAAAEATGLPTAAFDLVVLADALQWVDPRRGGSEAARLLAPGGTLAVVTSRLADTPFLSALAARIARANFKARPLLPRVAQLFAEAGLRAPAEERFHGEASLEGEDLDAVLRSLSFVGPALGPVALAALLADARALAAAHGGAVWRREITLAWARRPGSRAQAPARNG